MLDLMRKHSRSFIIYVFLGIIIAVFVINFGPQSAGCAAGTSYAGKVYGTPLTVSDFGYAQSVWGLRSQQGSEQQMIAMRAAAMDRLVARELLAADARELGLSVPSQEITEMLFNGRYLALGQPRPLIRNDDGEFDYELLSRYTKYYWGISVRKFRQQQRQELMADAIRQLIRSGVKASESEAKADFDQRNTRVKLSYVRFSAVDFLGEAKVDAQAIARYLEKNKKDVEKYYKDNQSAYKKLPRQYLIERLTLALPADPAAASRARSTMTNLGRRAAAQPDLRRLVAGSNAVRFDHVGWRNTKSAGLGGPIDEAIAGLKKGQTSAVLEHDRQLVLVRAADERQGDLSIEQVQEEIARSKLRDQLSLDLAKAAAAKAVAQVAAGKTLAELFPAAETKTNQLTKLPTAPILNGPQVKTTNWFSRSHEHLIPEIGVSEAISKAAFRLKAGALFETPQIVGKQVYVLSVAERQDADQKDWKKRKQEIISEFAQRKAQDQVRRFAHERCLAAARDNQISVNAAALATPGYIERQQQAGKQVVLPTYTPCATLEPTGGRRGLFM